MIYKTGHVELSFQDDISGNLQAAANAIAKPKQCLDCMRSICSKHWIDIAYTICLLACAGYSYSNENGERKHVPQREMQWKGFV